MKIVTEMFGMKRIVQFKSAKRAEKKYVTNAEKKVTQSAREEKGKETFPT